MPIYEIDLSVRTNLTVEVDAASADEAWQTGGEIMRRNALDEPVTARITSQYVDEIDMVRLKPEVPA